LPIGVDSHGQIRQESLVFFPKRFLEKWPRWECELGEGGCLLGLWIHVEGFKLFGMMLNVDCCGSGSGICENFVVNRQLVDAKVFIS
jgi:hypothetical protein